VQGCPLAVVDVVHVEDVIAVVFKEGHESTFLHRILYEQVAQLVQRFKNSLAITGLSLHKLRFWRFGVKEPLYAELLQVCEMKEGAGEGGEHIAMDQKRTQIDTVLTQALWQSLQQVLTHVQNLKTRQVLNLRRQLDEFVVRDSQFFKQSETAYLCLQCWQIVAVQAKHA